MHLEYGHLEYAQEVSGCTGSRTAYRSIVNCIYTAHIHILTAFFTNRIQYSQRKQTSFTVPTNLIENFNQHNLLLCVSLSACWKTGQNPCKNTHGENCIAQVGCWYFVRLCGAAGVGGEVSDEKNKPNTSIFELHFPPPEFTKKTNKF